MKEKQDFVERNNDWLHCGFTSAMLVLMNEFQKIFLGILIVLIIIRVVNLIIDYFRRRKANVSEKI